MRTARLQSKPATTLQKQIPLIESSPATEYRSSTHYDAPKRLSFNRHVDESHVKSLMTSMKTSGFTAAIILLYTNVISGKWELYLMDGQHRLEAAKRLKIPFVYKIVNCSDTDQFVKIMSEHNNSSKGWSSRNHLQVWAWTGKKSYIKLKKVVEDTGLQITPVVYAYTGNPSLVSFRQGKLDINDFLMGERAIERIMDMRNYISDKAFLTRAMVKTVLLPYYTSAIHKKLIENLKVISDTKAKIPLEETELFQFLKAMVIKMAPDKAKKYEEVSNKKVTATKKVVKKTKK